MLQDIGKCNGISDEYRTGNFLRMVDSRRPECCKFGCSAD